MSTLPPGSKVIVYEKLELLKNGIRLTDRVGAVADFLYNDGKPDPEVRELLKR